MKGAATWPIRGWDGFALALLLVQVLLLLGHRDLVTVGPDQTRDLAIIADLAAGRSFPLLGPMFHGLFKTGPAFYYLAALPYWLGGGVEAMRMGLALFQVFALVLAWWTLRRPFGARPAAWAMVLAVPPWQWLYARSAWNPALILPLAWLLLAALAQVAQGRSRYWLLVGLFCGLLLQVHLSALPLVLILSLWALGRLGREPRWIVSGILLGVLTLAPWFVHEFREGWPYLHALLTHRGAEGQGWLANLFAGAKWRDAALAGPRFFDGLQGLPTWADALGKAQWLALAVGLAAFLPRVRERWWLALVPLLWLLLGVGYLHLGFVYYLDVIHPWFALAAAIGLSRLCRPCPRLGAGVAVSVGLAILVSTQTLLRQWSRDGVLLAHLGDLAFPRLAPDRDSLWPFVAAPALDAYYAYLRARGIHPDQVVGRTAYLFRELDSRRRHAAFAALPPVSRPGGRPLWWLTGPPFQSPSSRGGAGSVFGAFALHPLGVARAGPRANLYLLRPADLETEPSPAYPWSGPLSVWMDCVPGRQAALLWRTLTPRRPDPGVEVRPVVSSLAVRWDHLSVLNEGLYRTRISCPSTPGRLLVHLVPRPEGRAAADLSLLPPFIPETGKPHVP